MIHFLQTTMPQLGPYENADNALIGLLNGMDVCNGFYQLYLGISNWLMLQYVYKIKIKKLYRGCK